MAVRSFKRVFKDTVNDFFSSMKWLPDDKYLRMYYFLRVHKKLNLKDPRGFNEKLNWLKINNQNPMYTKLADKLLVRDYIKEQLGDGYSIPLLGHWDRFEDIDFDSLPNAFVLKCNHDSGSVQVIKDKSLLTDKDKAKLSRYFSRHLKRNPYWFAREFAYRDIKPCIIAEKYMGNDLNDYKFFCFNGEPKLLLIVSGRFAEKHQDFFDMDFNPVNVYHGVPHSKVLPKRPASFDEMKRIAGELSQNIPTVRMGFYEQNGHVYFGEFTFYPAGGTLLFDPPEWERKLGDWIKLDKEK